MSLRGEAPAQVAGKVPTPASLCWGMCSAAGSRSPSFPAEDKPEAADNIFLTGRFTSDHEFQMDVKHTRLSFVAWKKGTEEVVFVKPGG